MIFPIIFQMVEAAGLVIDEKNELRGRDDFLSFSSSFSKSLRDKSSQSYSVEGGVLSLSVTYDLGSYSSVGVIPVR